MLFACSLLWPVDAGQQLLPIQRKAKRCSTFVLGNCVHRRRSTLAINDRSMGKACLSRPRTGDQDTACFKRLPQPVNLAYMKRSRAPSPPSKSTPHVPPCHRNLSAPPLPKADSTSVLFLASKPNRSPHSHSLPLSFIGIISDDKHPRDTSHTRAHNMMNPEQWYDGRVKEVHPG